MSHAVGRRWGCVVLLSSLLLTSCQRTENQYVPPPPPEVTVASPVSAELMNYLEYNGNLAAYEFVEIQPRTKGYVEKIHFRPGTFVNKGDLLVTIDSRPAKAALAKAEAELKAKLAIQQRSEDRLQRAKAAGTSVPREEVILIQETLNEVKAEVELYRANVDLAKLELDYTSVRAPISGRISRNLVDTGALVAEGTPLTTIAHVDKLYAYFVTTERNMLAYRRLNPDARTHPGGKTPLPVFIGLEDDIGYPREGVFDAPDNQIDAETGTLQLRALFDNPDRLLVPGSNIRVRIPAGKEKCLLVPAAAIGIDQGGKYVLVVDDNNKVERRSVTVGAIEGALRRIQNGIQISDRIVINGLQRARPGAIVTPIVGSFTESSPLATK
ncbi:efflux RND transporter periplasmic adaptor subunit [Tuwongella immobilis]|uniref:Uncharacterized protein n=1 Tax=Tuwongella immobilis TaxID=692036 RepID=A0A6C2YM03_9BACT|nr:efflux RND transporter periplasmic adaptor subunit [Tuwongella immobilis]VIP02259.1 rnd family efflux mfp subunit : RND family efflux transporter, MFP subunit OS=Desulfomonile tiedjei (strain ATCC 49306 / DSM 6799 / DCB-1) GN=Desti_1331 PE=4 SV=1: HlyD [Tuwongella immobilis]VTS00864.1 rnd family efflux mfp subunit : RND family efflux transporter, MFP subunit OS=Desulfomonile tiedjei (strain ATCC 49306 / DSM 6799 / DCB-1) GN=Desti_1331 PE=4 SV=1: HlyD [Tuwongella immobilis]